MSQLLLDISDLATSPGAHKDVRGAFVIDGLATGMGSVREPGGVELDLRAESVVEGIAVSGSVAGEFSLACSRCLVPFELPFDQQVDEVYHRTAPEDSDAYVIEGAVIDLEPLVRDSVVLAMPTRPLHTEECAGLCPVCGEDLNVVDCGHDVRPVDVRWLPLEELKEQMKSEESQTREGERADAGS